MPPAAPPPRHRREMTWPSTRRAARAAARARGAAGAAAGPARVHGRDLPGERARRAASGGAGARRPAAPGPDSARRRARRPVPRAAAAAARPAAPGRGLRPAANGSAAAGPVRATGLSRSTRRSRPTRRNLVTHRRWARPSRRRRSTRRRWASRSTASRRWASPTTAERRDPRWQACLASSSAPLSPAAGHRRLGALRVDASEVHVLRAPVYACRRLGQRRPWKSKLRRIVASSSTPSTRWLVGTQTHHGWVPQASTRRRPELGVVLSVTPPRPNKTSRSSASLSNWKSVPRYTLLS